MRAGSDARGPARPCRSSGPPPLADPPGPPAAPAPGVSYAPRSSAAPWGRGGRRGRAGAPGPAACPHRSPASPHAGGNRRRRRSRSGDRPTGCPAPSVMTAAARGVRRRGRAPRSSSGRSRSHRVRRARRWRRRRSSVASTSLGPPRAIALETSSTFGAIGGVGGPHAGPAGPGRGGDAVVLTTRRVPPCGASAAIAAPGSRRAPACRRRGPPQIAVRPDAHAAGHRRRAGELEAAVDLRVLDGARGDHGRGHRGLVEDADAVDRAVTQRGVHAQVRARSSRRGWSGSTRRSSARRRRGRRRGVALDHGRVHGRGNARSDLQRRTSRSPRRHDLRLVDLDAVEDRSRLRRRPARPSGRRRPRSDFGRVRRSVGDPVAAAPRAGRRVDVVGPGEEADGVAGLGLLEGRRSGHGSATSVQSDDLRAARPALGEARRGRGAEPAVARGRGRRRRGSGQRGMRQGNMPRGDPTIGRGP